ncbi:hypothetical protein SAMN05444162_2279 [Paenibacillaceae bacterium GAS479]|nr:hypothetical protein SAMN05444162_2279 [Paenibacillaceae bacterium GAS479]
MWKANSGSKGIAAMRDDRGSSLLLVVFLILLLSLLGVAVLGASLGGAMRTERSEENVQSLHLAQKGLDEAVAAIYDRFNNRSIDPESLGKQLASFTTQFNKQLVNEEPSGNSNLDAASRPFFQVISVLCADSGQCKSPVGEGSGAYQYALIVTAEAKVDGAIRRMQQEIVLDTYPDFLKYAFGSEGIVTVNGAPYFMGNLYAGQGLHLSDTAQYIYLGKPRTQVTQFMFLDPIAGAANTVPADSSGWIVTGNGSQLLYGYGANYTDDASGYTALYDNRLAAASGVDKVKTHGLGDRIRIEPPQKFVSIDVKSSFLDKVRDSIGPNADAVTLKETRTVIENVYATSGASGLINRLKGDYAASYDLLGSQPTMAEKEPVLPDILLQSPPTDDGTGDKVSEGAESGTSAGQPSGTVVPSSTEYEQAKQEYELKLADYLAKKTVYQLDLEAFGASLSSIGAASRPGSAIVDGPLVLDQQLPAIDFASKGKHNWLIVNGDLELRGAPLNGMSEGEGATELPGGTPEGEGTVEPMGDTEEGDALASVPLKLRGNILVTGNMTLSGQVDVDATVYVLGRTDIRDAAIHGLSPSQNEPRKELVLIGSGPIDLYRVDSFQPVGSGYGNDNVASSQVLDAFLYTDSSANLYGVGSAFWMKGGFFSKGNLTLNGTMGSTTENGSTGRLEFQEQLGGIGKERARFIIEYNSSVFASQGAALPRVSKVRLTTGPLKLIRQDG